MKRVIDLKVGDEVYVRGEVVDSEAAVFISSAGVVLENCISGKRTLLVRLERYCGETEVEKKVPIKYINKL